ncbi:uncharacterized protein METZ01_LOCUS501771, partial [marine metagenome]
MMNLVGVPLKHKKCRSHTKKNKMCSKTRKNGSFFCRCHNSLEKLTAAGTFSASLIALCEMLRVQKYKYPLPIPEPKRGSRISVRFVRIRSLTSPGTKLTEYVYFWLTGTVVGYDKNEHRHVIRYDDTETRKTKMIWTDWVYSDTTNTASGNIPEEKIKAQIQQDYYKIMQKYGNLFGAI